MDLKEFATAVQAAMPGVVDGITHGANPQVGDNDELCWDQVEHKWTIHLASGDQFTFTVQHTMVGEEDGEEEEW